MNEKILKMYFEDKMKQIEIAKKLNISKYKVSRVVTKDLRYKKEREDRKEKNKFEHKVKTKNYIIEKRKNKKDDMTYEKLKQMHIQATKELSDGRNIISDRAFLKWNSSAYKYNFRKKRYEFDKKLGRSYAVPEYIKFE